MDTIRRQDAINAIYEAFYYAYCDNCEKEMNEDLCGDCHRKYQNWSASKKTIEKVINNLPSAEPRWRVISRRPLDENERIEWSERFGYDIEYDAFIYSNLPDAGEKVIICTHSEYVCTDIYHDDDGCYFDNFSLYEVVAWMPYERPEPWKGASDDKR